MVQIINSSNERINNIHTFLQGSNPIGLGDECIKSVLALEMACEELTSTEQMKRSRIENAPQLPAPKNNLSVMFKAAAAKEEKLFLKEEGFNAASVLVGSLTALRQLLHEGNISELANRLQLLNIESNTLREKGNDLLSSFTSNPSAHASSKPLASAESKFSPDINALLPKPMVSARRFELVEVTDKMTGETKKSWQAKVPEEKNIILSGHGALTRNQADKERYASGPIASSTEKMGIPNNTNTFSSSFKSTEIVDEVTGEKRITWQLSDAKTSQSVTLTEMGALTRNQADKERYNDNTTRSEKG